MATKKQWTEQQKTEALAMAEKVGVAEAARKMGIPKSTIGTWRKSARQKGKKRMGTAVKASNPVKKNKRDLTAKQRVFVSEYLIDLNATQAAIRAGYSEKNADKIGSELLGKTRIKEEIEARLQEREKSNKVTAEKVIAELAKIAFANGADYARVVEKTGRRVILDEKGEKIGEEPYTYSTVEIVPTGDLPEEKKAAIAGIKETRHGIEVASCDKVKALELLGKYLSLFTEKREISGTLTFGLADLVQEVEKDVRSPGHEDDQERDDQEN